MKWKKEERYTVETVNGKRVLAPKDVETSTAVMKERTKEKKRTERKERKEDSHKIDRMVKDYRERETAEKLVKLKRKMKEKKKKKKEWDIKMARLRKLAGHPPKKQGRKQTGKKRKVRYVIVKGKAVPVYTKPRTVSPPKKTSVPMDLSFDSLFSSGKKGKKKSISLSDEMKKFQKDMGM